MPIHLAGLVMIALGLASIPTAHTAIDLNENIDKPSLKMIIQWETEDGEKSDPVEATVSRSGNWQLSLPVFENIDLIVFPEFDKQHLTHVRLGLREHNEDTVWFDTIRQWDGEPLTMNLPPVDEEAHMRLSIAIQTAP